MIPTQHLERAKEACKDMSVNIEELTFREGQEGTTTALHNGKFICSFSDNHFSYRLKYKHVEHTIKAHYPL